MNFRKNALNCETNHPKRIFMKFGAAEPNLVERVKAIWTFHKNKICKFPFLRAPATACFPGMNMHFFGTQLVIQSYSMRLLKHFVQDRKGHRIWLDSTVNHLWKNLLSIRSGSGICVCASIQNACPWVERRSTLGSQEIVRYLQNG